MTTRMSIRLSTFVRRLAGEALFGPGPQAADRGPT
jgi:hypothetical protein